MSKISDKINEIIAGFGCGSVTGIGIAILAFFALNIWYLFVGEFIFLTTIVVWVSCAMISISYYKLLRQTFFKEFAFFVGLLVAIGLISYGYNILAYDILPYSSLETFRIIALAIIGTGLGFAGKMIAKIKEETKEITQ